MMSEQVPFASPSSPETVGTKSNVSTTRKRISAILLLISVTVLFLELRSKLGPYWTGIAFAKMTEEGAFTGQTFEEVRSHLWLFPSVSIEHDTSDETLYCYSWYSPLRHLRRSPQIELFLAASKETPPHAIVYYNDRETPEEHARKLAIAYGISDRLTGSGTSGSQPQEESSVDSNQ